MPTNLYDNTFPPATQLASQGAADLQQVRLDVQERMALISGTLAARWNPGADIQPAKWTGLLYFATDTNQLFRWNGGAWVLTYFSPASKYSDASSNSVAANNSGTLNTITVPANTMSGTGSYFRLVAFGNMTGGSGQGLLTLKLNGVAFGTPTNVSGNDSPNNYTLLLDAIVLPSAGTPLLGTALLFHGNSVNHLPFSVNISVTAANIFALTTSNTSVVVSGTGMSGVVFP